MHKHAVVLFAVLLSVSACDTGLSLPEGDTSQFPTNEEDRREARIGRLSGDEGIVLTGPSDKKSGEANNPLGVNSFLWRASLDTLNFMPFTQVDPFGGVIITDWYEDPESPGERFKANVLILDRQLRADSVKVALFKQKLVPEVGDEDEMEWRDAKVGGEVPRQLEDAILTRARELRVKQLGY